MCCHNQTLEDRILVRMRNINGREARTSEFAGYTYRTIGICTSTIRGAYHASAVAVMNSAILVDCEKYFLMIARYSNAINSTIPKHAIQSDEGKRLK